MSRPDLSPAEETRTPKKVKAYVASLERRILDLEARNRLLAWEAPAHPWITLDPYHHGTEGAQRKLNRHERVRFTFRDEPEFHDDFVDVHLTEYRAGQWCLALHAGGGALVAAPQAANAFQAFIIHR